MGYPLQIAVRYLGSKSRGAFVSVGTAFAILLPLALLFVLAVDLDQRAADIAHQRHAGWLVVDEDARAVGGAADAQPGLARQQRVQQQRDVRRRAQFRGAVAALAGLDVPVRPFLLFGLGATTFGDAAFPSLRRRGRTRPSRCPSAP